MSSPQTRLVDSARREAILCGVVFVAAITYSVSTCARLGYRDPALPMEFVLGFPDWIFWGVIVPWGVCTVLSALFSFVIMQDHDMGEAADAPVPPDAAFAATTTVDPRTGEVAQ